MPTAADRAKREYEALYRATGEFIREWAEFEQYLMWPASALLGIDQWRARLVLASHRSFRGKSDLLLQLSATFAADAAHERLSKMLKRARSIADKRNIVAHQHGGMDAHTNRVVFLSDQNDPAVGINFAGHTKFDIANFDQWIAIINELKGECIAIFKSCCSIVYVEPKMHRKPASIE